MKPKYRNLIRKALPALIIVPATAGLTIAAPIPTALNGSLIVTSADNGANHILVNGGASPIVEIDVGTILSADGGNDGIEINSAGYFDPSFDPANPTALTRILGIRNAGIITGGDSGLDANDWKITLYNTGILASATDDGIHDLGTGSVVANARIIIGTNGGILSNDADNVIIHNTGTIDGDSDNNGSGIGIDLEDGAIVVNSSLITGGAGGIQLNDNGNITNQFGASIIGNDSGNGNGINFRDDTTGINTTADISNYGSIIGNIGVNVRHNVSIVNYSPFIPFSSFDSYSTITGAQIVGTNGNGITARDYLNVTNQQMGLIQGSTNGIDANYKATIINSGEIEGLGGTGIFAEDEGTVTNYGSIVGTGTGVRLDENATVNNYSGATIAGTNIGVRVGGDSTVNNSGSIQGNIGIDAFTDSGASFTLNNSGRITGTGGIAIDGASGPSSLNLNDGSVIIGDVRAPGGSLSITMNGGLTSTGDSTQNIINGSVFDALTLSKTGSGMAVVTGTTAADSISVTGGYLYLRNNVTNIAGGENTISADGAAIGGLGTWDSAIFLTNGASISGGTNPLALTNTVSSSIGTLTVAGNVTLDSSSDYVWNVTPGGAFDVINVTDGGVFTTNNSDFVISPTNVNSPLLDGSTIVVDTATLLGGSFNSISVASFPSTTPDTGLFQANQNNPIIAEYFTTLSKVNGNQDWELTVAHDYSMFGSTDNEVAAGEMLNELVNTTSDEDVADLLAAMDYSDESVTEGVLAALDPGAYMATAAALTTNNYHLHRTVENHNAAVRAGSSAIVAPSEPSAKGAVAAPMMTSGCTGSSNVWGSFSYDWQDLETSNSDFDQDGDVYSFTAGIDFTVAENFRLGLVAEGSQSDMDGDYNLGSEVESYRFAAYANWGSATGWFVDALLGYNTHSVDQSRSTFMALAATESASYDADGWQGLINAGYAFQTTAGTFSPYLGLEWQQLSVDSFDTEDGPLPISVGGYDVDSFRALAGVRWEAALTESVKGYASATYAFEFEDDAVDTTVEFGDGSYRASGMELGDAVLLSAGIRWGVATCTTLDVGYRGEFAMDDGVDSNGANIGLNYSF
jgi:subtilase-type serine protease